MKSRVPALPILVALIITASTILSYRSHSYAETVAVSPPSPSPAISQSLPTPTVKYNRTLGILESEDSPQILDSLTQYNLRLNKIYRTPLNVSLKDGSGLTDITLDTHILRSILVPTSLELNVPPGLDKAALLTYLTAHLTPKQKPYFNPTIAYENTRKAINLRFMGAPTPLVLGVDDGPSSSGELAARYLEIDLSQQKMYFFIDHALYKEYRVSTGAEYPTPIGEYHILNKAPIAYSDIYSVWMPYWMGFTYAAEVGAYLGIHEIAYALDERGKPFYNHGYYIGDMMTGGCVAMEPKDSREIYNLSEVGMLVRIVP